MFPWKALRALNLTSQIFLLSIIAFFGFILRVANLNYNSAFSDEAIYVVVGQLGIFHGDWYSYNAPSWLSGSQYLYPSLSALAYSLGGLMGSRMVSVVSGTALIFLTFFLSLQFSKKLKYKVTAALISTLLVAGSTTALYVSRLATMDMLSFSIFFASILVLQKTINKKVADGQMFFVAGSLLFLAALVKLSVVFYFPLVLIYGYFSTVKKQKEFFKNYFILPLAVFSLMYFLFNINSLGEFAQLQASRGKSALSSVVNTIWDSYKYLTPFALIGVIFAKFRLTFKTWMFLVVGGCWISLIHLAQMRAATLDKHLILGFVFLAVLSGIGWSFLLEKISNIKLSALTLLASILLTAGLFCYLVLSYQNLYRFNSGWLNTSQADKFLSQQVSYGDKVLSEIGPTTILTLYSKTEFSNISTFDYFKYGEIEGEEAYRNSVRDGYFNYIVLQSNSLPKADANQERHNLVIANMDGNYELTYDRGGISIYKRSF